MANQGDGELKRILVALREVTAGKVEDNTVDYMAGMLQEEGIATLNGESAAELIGEFLVDAAVAQDSADAEVICERLLHMLQVTDGARVDCSAGKSKRTETARDFVTPLKMADVAGDTDNNSFSDPYLGLNADSTRVNYNTPVLGGAAGEAKAAAAAAEQQQRLQQQRERHLRALKEWEKNKPPLPPLKRRHGDKQLKKLGEGIIVDRFSLSVAGRELLTDAQLKLMKGRRYGLAGRNGIGKSTLLNALARHEIQGVNFGFSIGMVEQEHVWGTETALESVLAVDDDRTQLLAEEKLLLSQNDKSEKVGRRLATIYERLEEIDAANAESVAATILSGLGFTEAMQHAQVTTLSGGWRMRVLLARCLFSDADVLLLDEPTNHLDLEAVQWLTSYLALKPDAAAAASTPGVAASSAPSSSLSSSSSCASSSATTTAAGAGKERGKGKAAAAATGGGGGGAAAGPGGRAGGAARPTAAAPMRCARDKIVVVVSHAREFLNDVCTDMIHFANQSLSYYRGNYDTFEAVRASQLQQQQRQADAQQQKVKHMQSFIDKFRYNAKRASLVQSRIKLLNKLPLLDVVAADPTLQFQFHVPEPLGAPLLQAEGVYFKYERKQEEERKTTAFDVAVAEDEDEEEEKEAQADEEEEDATAAEGSEGREEEKRAAGGDAGGDDGEGEGRGEGGEEGKKTKKGRGAPYGADQRSSNHCVPASLAKKAFDEPGEKFVVKNMNFSVDMDSRIALCGVNGSGKSTVLKLLVGKEKPHAGIIHQNGKLRIGYFTQQHVDQLDLTLNAVHSLQTKYPEANLKDEEARAWLSQFGITGLLALEPLYILSGGQKSRVAIALMAFNNPHILLLDEPTNHLDLDAVQALMAALNNFKGGVVIVSHDSHLLSCVVEEIYYMDEKNQTLCKFKGDFPEYKKQLLKSRRAGLNN